MIYLEDEHLTIRDLTHQDISFIDQALIRQNWSKRTDVLESRLILCNQKKMTALIAVFKGEVAGMIFLHHSYTAGPYQNIPFIEDLLIFKPYQGLKISSKLMDVTERIAKSISNKIALAVGLHSGYGNAHVLYAKRGYIPSGCGVWYQDQIAPSYKEVHNDDDLLLYLSKSLSTKSIT